MRPHRRLPSVQVLIYSVCDVECIGAVSVEEFIMAHERPLDFMVVVM